MGIPALDHVDLQDTFVLSWRKASGSLTFEVLANLLPTHPRAAPPLPNEWACYTEGAITFFGVTSVAGLPALGDVVPVKDPDGSIDYGCIDELSLAGPGEYRIAGEFGSVSVAAEGLSFVLHSAA